MSNSEAPKINKYPLNKGELLRTIRADRGRLLGKYHEILEWDLPRTQATMAVEFYAGRMVEARLVKDGVVLTEHPQLLNGYVYQPDSLININYAIHDIPRRRSSIWAHRTRDGESITLDMARVDNGVELCITVGRDALYSLGVVQSSDYTELLNELHARFEQLSSQFSTIQELIQTLPKK